MLTRLKLEDEERVWFTSDLHLLHRNIACKERSNWDGGWRNFKDEYQMTDILLDNINSKVGVDDVLFFLGDFCFKDHKRIPDLRGRLICQRIYWILGNHDQHWEKYRNYFTACTPYLALEYDGEYVVMSHYPILSWDRVGRGSFMLHGHTHSHPNINKMDEEHGKRMDVGVDHYYRLYGEYMPFSWQEVRRILGNKSTVQLDHHTKNSGI